MEIVTMSSPMEIFAMEKSSPASKKALNERKAKEEDHGVISAGNDAHARENAGEPKVTDVRGDQQEKR